MTAFQQRPSQPTLFFVPDSPATHNRFLRRWDNTGSRRHKTLATGLAAWTYGPGPRGRTQPPTAILRRTRRAGPISSSRAATPRFPSVTSRRHRPRSAGDSSAKSGHGPPCDCQSHGMDRWMEMAIMTPCTVLWSHPAVGGRQTQSARLTAEATNKPSIRFSCNPLARHSIPSALPRLKAAL
jgi:hypothetical protein